MTGKITGEVLESYLRCRTKGRLKLLGEHGTPSQYEILLAELRAEVGAMAVSKLLGQHKGEKVVRHQDASTKSG